MTREQFVSWRSRCGLTCKAAAEALGVSLRAVQYYASGGRVIPKTVEKLCGMIEG